MVDRPIIFSGAMVRALLAGRKTQTRRLVKPQPPQCVTSAGVIARTGEGQTDEWSWLSGDPKDCDTWGFEGDFSVRYRPGDRLYVRENFQLLSLADYLPTKSEPADVRFAATDPCADLPADARGYSWRPCIHMPRWASRLTLIVEDVRVERLQDISEADAIAEGIAEYPCEGPHRGEGATFWTAELGHPEHGARFTPVSAYRALWESLHGDDSWTANPFVVALTFRVVRGNIDQVRQ